MPIPSLRSHLPVRLVAAGVAAAALLAGPLSQSALAASASDTYEADTATYTNRQRHIYKKVWLNPSSCLDSFAEKQAAAMAAQKKMYHQSLGPILSRCKLSLVGENVAYGYASGHDVVGAWMHSAGHRTNILRDQYRLIAIGAAQDSDGVWYVSQVFGTPA